MNAGLPTTGIGGIFYTVSVLFMLLSELIKLVLGKSSLESWKIVSQQVFLVVSMIFIIFLTSELLNAIIPQDMALNILDVSKEFTVARNTNNLFLLPLFLLVFLVASTQVLRLYFYVRSRKLFS